MFNLYNFLNYKILTIQRNQSSFMLKTNANVFFKPIDFKRCEEQSPKVLGNNQIMLYINMCQNLPKCKTNSKCNLQKQIGKCAKHGCNTMGINE